MIVNLDIDTLVASVEEIGLPNFLTQINIKLSNLLEESLDTNLWKDHVKHSLITKEIKTLNNDKELYLNLDNTRLELLMAIQEVDQSLIESLYLELFSIFNEYNQLKYLDGKFDQNDVTLSVQVGAGGLDAEDWASTLISMYQAFCMNQKWECVIIEITSGIEGGVKKCTLKIKGKNVYGMLKHEFGVHRLVRLSPFNSAHTRETSFALVEVIPLGIQELINIQVVESDLKWEYTTSQGAGGQSVNTTYSAVKLTHIPTNISVQCQNERSQLQNKQMALKYLKNKLSILESQKRDEFKQEFRENYQKPEWGSQIRNYVLHPYKLVKDLRSNWETNNIDDILEKGNLLDMIWSVKKVIYENKN